MSPDLFIEASEIVAGVAAQDPIGYSQEGLDDGCHFCGACDFVYGERPRNYEVVGATDHEPDCLWIRARRLTRQPVHPHKVRSS